MGRLLDREGVGGGLFRHRLEPPAGLSGTYRSPGQYVSVSVGGKETYFVLAGDPACTPWEVLVRAGGDVADALLALPLGAALGLSAARGAGFPLAEAAGRRLFVLAAGTGVAAIRPVLGARVLGGLAALTEVFVGVRVRAELPLEAELARRRAEGVRVTVCLSREAGAGFASESGYVQDALVRRVSARPTDAEGAMIFAAGPAAMVEQARVAARTLGLAEADVRTNY